MWLGFSVPQGRASSSHGLEKEVGLTWSPGVRRGLVGDALRGHLEGVGLGQSWSVERSRPSR